MSHKLTQLVAVGGEQSIIKGVNGFGFDLFTLRAAGANSLNLIGDVLEIEATGATGQSIQNGNSNVDIPSASGTVEVTVNSNLRGVWHNNGGFVGGGSTSNSVNNSVGSNNAIIGGDNNDITSKNRSAICGGQNNAISADDCGIFGAKNSTAGPLGANNLVVGGDNNLVNSGSLNTLIGGSGNAVGSGSGQNSSSAIACTDVTVNGTNCVGFGRDFTLSGTLNYAFADSTDTLGNSGQNRTVMFWPNREGQVVIGAENPDGSAILDISSGDRGVLLPRMSTVQRDAISGPANGLIIYNLTTSKFQGRAGGAWADLN